uniref:C2H2-type domain-containing protein n=1 Tax=Anopheles dirus TaxID=7168 RepID=A0A182NEX3_9DIPT
MDGMCFDYDHYFAEETFVIDDFGEIFEDVVRIANASSHYLCRDFDAELRHESPPPASFIASNRCFEKEVSSLFSEMEYLTEVSPGTGVSMSGANAITIAVNPTEFSHKRSVRCGEAPNELQKQTIQATVVESTVEPPFENRIESSPKMHVAAGNVSAPLEYQRILNNYIQKGRPSTTTSASQRLCKSNRLHHCRDCTSSFASGDLLRKHSCIIAEQYQCHLCLREFKKRKTLEHHMKSHDKVFSTDDDLRK